MGAVSGHSKSRQQAADGSWHQISLRAFTNHRDTEECFALKSEIRNTKHETNIKSEFSNVQNVTTREDL
jgi:hypothetical protein